MGIIFPDYQNSILNLVSSLLHSYGAPCAHGSLPDLDQLFARPIKNKILLILDGCGSEFLRRQLPADGFLRSHYKRDLSSVYPCTTTAATTSMLSGLSPLEHGWLGWSPWIREYGRIIDLFLDRDSLSGATIAPSAAPLLLPYEDIIPQIERYAEGLVQCHKVLPSYDPHGVNSFSEMIGRIREYSQLAGPQLIMAYWHEPDTLMHNEGPYSETVRHEMLLYDRQLADLMAELDDTLLVVTADHGQVAVTREIFIDEHPAVHDCLVVPPTLETRATSFFVKTHRRQEFVAAFNDLLGDCFLLMPREEVLARGLFGPGQAHHRVDDFLGDYLACATGQTIIRYHSLFNRPRFSFKGHHAGLCPEEMLVPLIIVQKG
jgi:hypothetical protein